MVREPERITRIISKIQTIWSKYPDLRFFQFILWIEHEFSKQHRNYGKKVLIEKDQYGIEMPLTVINLFNLEDDKFENFLDQLIDEINQ